MNSDTSCVKYEVEAFGKEKKMKIILLSVWNFFIDLQLGFLLMLWFEKDVDLCKAFTLHPFECVH